MCYWEFPKHMVTAENITSKLQNYNNTVQCIKKNQPWQSHLTPVLTQTDCAAWGPNMSCRWTPQSSI